MSTTVVIEDSEVRELLKGLIKNVGQISQRGKKYVGLLSAVVLGDVVDHFAKEAGPDGRWKPWSKSYHRFMVKIGKGGNLILSDTGRLRQGWQPTRYRVAQGGILWFNPITYGEKHDEGIGVPQRKFTWLSDNAIDKIEQQTADFILDV